MRSVICLLALSTGLLATQAWAQEAARTEPQPEPHGGRSAEIVVSASYLNRLDVVAGQSVIKGDELARDIRGQIGDSLTRQPGVSATSFTAGASRPVLRGFQGERIRVLTDGLGSLDVSNTSADHGVAIDPLTAERIEVLRGPAVLLFGSQAIGGAVNVLDRRIPRAMPEKAYHLDALAGYGTAADDRSLGSSLDVALGSQIVAHVDGSWRRSDDVEVGGFVLSPRLRAEQLAVAQEDLAEGQPEAAARATALAGLRGRVPNSASRTWSAGGGVALINDGGSLGASVGYYDSRYGVPERPGGAGEATGAEPAPVHIGMRQWRADVRGEIDAGGGFLDKIRTRIGYADYRHTEFEGDEAGTTFYSDAVEGRLELVQANRNGWRGVIGAQGFMRDFNAVGEEAFVPPNTTAQYGLFTLQEFERGGWGLELAGRYEHTTVNSDQVRSATGTTIGVSRSFDALSGAAGLSYALTPQLKLGITGSRATRAPSAEELFANGPHVATRSFEIGDPGFASEKSWGLETWLRGGAGPLRLSFSAYAQWFTDYIYEAETGRKQDGLPVFQYLQADARYYGLEGEAETTLLESGGFSLSGNLVADYVDARISGGGRVPRIPPLRVLAGLQADADRWGGRIEAEHVFAQNRIAAFETPTDGYTLVNASLTWRPWGKARETSLILSANNIFDVDARRHASFTKDFVPLPGRDLRLSARFSF